MMHIWWQLRRYAQYFLFLSLSAFASYPYRIFKKSVVSVAALDVNESSESGIKSTHNTIESYTLVTDASSPASYGCQRELLQATSKLKATSSRASKPEPEIKLLAKGTLRLIWIRIYGFKISSGWKLISVSTIHEERRR